MSLFARSVIAIALRSLFSEGFCPKGFGGQQDFPDEWKIPKWPQMELDEAVKLHTVTLGGFKMTSINEEYLEGPSKEFHMQGRETYWQASGKYFMYYCQRFTKWRIAEISAFSQNMDGNCFAFVSDAHPGRDILNSTLIKSWIEVDEGKWVLQKDAGVTQVGVLADQLAAQESDEETEMVEDCGNETDASDDPFNPDAKRDKACPLRPIIKKAKDTVVEGVTAAGKWVRRLFPKFALGETDAEDAIPEGEENPLFNSEAERTPFDCNPETEAGCNFKEKFYIEKQSKLPEGKLREEIERLRKMRDVVMKQDQTDWVLARLHILKHLVLKRKGAEEL